MPDPSLPAPDAASLTLLVVPGGVVQQYDADPTIVDAVSVTDADAVLPVAPNANVAAQRLLHTVDVPVLRTDRGMRADTAVSPTGALVVVATPTPDTLPDSPSAVGTSGRQPDRVVVVSDAFEMRVVPRKQETVLDGLDEYLAQLPDAWHPADSLTAADPVVVHASTAVEAGYTATYPATAAGETAADASAASGDAPPVRVAGVGQAASLGAAADTTSQSLTAATLYDTGQIATDTHDPGNFGLYAVDQLGDARINTLQSHGVRSREQLTTMSVDAVANTLGVGQATARTITTSADAVETGTVVRTSAAELPSDPVFIDIETDGLGASVAWLIGVLNGSPADGSYYAFRQQTPGDPSAHLDAFLTWMQGIPRSRPLVAWNGYGFDFDILTEQVRQHCPDRLEEWESRRTFDLLYWARNKDNAVLPGHSNKLEAVATAVGWEPDTVGVDGETAARIYSRWRDAATTADAGADIPAPDWDRLEAYCEDDVRALATIWEAVDDAPVRPAAGGTSSSGATGRQGSLSDFS